MKIFATFARGIVMGIAEIIPGVSGSTLALLMGIYDDFINFLSGISDFLKEVIKFILFKSSVKDVKSYFFKIKFQFGIPLVFGMAFSLALFSNVITHLLEEYTAYVFAFLFGLVLASIAIPWKEMKSKTIKEFSVMGVTFVIFFIILGLKPIESASNNPLFLFVSGALAICAMVLPGISGSFILLMLGVYSYVVGLVKDLTRLSISAEGLLNLTLVALGIVVGFSIFVKILKKGLEKYPSIIMAFLIGIMIASLRVLWPFIDVEKSTPSSTIKLLPWEVPANQILASLVIIVAAMLIVLLLNKFAKPSNLD